MVQDGGDVGKELGIDPLAGIYASVQGDRCAARTWAEGHFWVAVVVFEIALLCGLYGWHFLFAVTFLAMTTTLLVIVGFRVLLVLISLMKKPQIVISPECLAETESAELPVYTILVPLYREAEVAEGIVRALSHLHYPRELLEVLLLLEADDEVTIAAVKRLSLGPEFQVITVPPGLPRTKPKACNYGLSQARGQYTVIYDAEDRPESDQLLKVVAAMRQADERVACIQANLNYYNPRENFLTRCFTIEYTVWFDLVLPAVQYLDGPIPLGGTSNHFKTSVLKELGGWDPFNVTEDCDLGVRLAIDGYRTLMLDSTTWEEANRELGNWIRQRSRWVKGYLQTYLVHTKQLFGLWRALGGWRTGLFHLCISSVPIQQLLNLVCWPLTIVYLALLMGDLLSGREIWTVVAGSRDEYRWAWKSVYWEAGDDVIWAYFSVIGFIGSLFMLTANGGIILINLLACRRRGYCDLWLAALLSPIYWTLASVAAWRGAWQLIRNPHYWEKTNHGLSQVEPSINGLLLEEHVT